ncbi:MAG: DUF4783 domain-containing protein [Chitinophagaceae bacterium]
MKAILSSILIMSVVALSAFGQQSSVDEVISAFRSGNASELSKHFDETLELTLPVKSNSYSKAQAQQMMKDFFENQCNGVKGFELIHKGTSPEGYYFVGNLEGNSGKFRTNVYMKTKGNKEVIKKIRFEPVQ